CAATNAMTLACVRARRNCSRTPRAPLDFPGHAHLLQGICICIMRHLLPLLAAGLALVTCGESETDVQTDCKPVVFVSVPTYAGLVERVAGDSVEVVSLVGESDDPHTFSPTPKVVAALSDASVFFTAELPFEERLLEKLAETNRNLKIV